MLFGQNAAIASACFTRTIGQLIPAHFADIIVVDYDPPTLSPLQYHGHILFGVSGRAVQTPSWDELSWTG